MKKIFLAFLLFAGTTFTANAHITKAEIMTMLTELGTSLDKINEVYVYNTMTYFTDGTSKQTFDKYLKEKGNHLSLTDTGIKLTYKPEGVLTSVFFMPYDSILTIDVGVNYISVWLKQ